MTIARKEVLDRTKSETIHIYARTVRRSFLCVKDPVSGNDYEHRRTGLKSESASWCPSLGSIASGLGLCRTTTILEYSLHSSG